MPPPPPLSFFQSLSSFLLLHLLSFPFVFLLHCRRVNGLMEKLIQEIFTLPWWVREWKIECVSCHKSSLELTALDCHRWRFCNFFRLYLTFHRHETSALVSSTLKGTLEASFFCESTGWICIWELWRGSNEKMELSPLAPAWKKIIIKVLWLS